jgi:hypothetical protein
MSPGHVLAGDVRGNRTGDGEDCLNVPMDGGNLTAQAIFVTLLQVSFAGQ